MKTFLYDSRFQEYIIDIKLPVFVFSNAMQITACDIVGYYLQCSKNSSIIVETTKPFRKKTKMIVGNQLLLHTQKDICEMVQMCVSV